MNDEVFFMRVKDAVCDAEAFSIPIRIEPQKCDDDCLASRCRRIPRRETRHNEQKGYNDGSLHS